jgi:hypothetical protein
LFSLNKRLYFSRGVKTEKVYRNTKKTEDWKSVTVSFKNNPKIGWKTIRAPKNGGKKQVDGVPRQTDRRLP